MRWLLYVLPGLALITLALWAYSENYETQRAISKVRDLHRQIGVEHETLSILRAEWAYLNRPERLRDLTDLNFETLRLLPLLPHHFGDVDQIRYPAPPLGPLDGTVTLRSEELP